MLILVLCISAARLASFCKGLLMPFLYQPS